MGGTYETQFDENAPTIRQLTKGQRRALGVLIEKAFTTPDQYPLTLKSATSGANQKSNRAPVANYTEGAVWELLDELRELGLIAVVHPESGRTERFRHYMRRRFQFSEPQLAIMTELMLRGRQQLGELRARASRMVPIENLDELRRELTSLQEQGYTQASGSLERRGIEVDHNMYADGEDGKLESSPTALEEPRREVIQNSQPSPNVTQPAGQTDEINSLKSEMTTLHSEVESLRQTIEEIKDSLDDLRHSLGV